MAKRIEDYAFIGDNHTGALVGRDGSIDWLCLPEFDSGACFAALLGDAGNGRWRLAPSDPGARVSRSYRAGTLILDTEFRTRSGVVKVTDFMPPRHRHPTLVRIVTGIVGRVEMEMDLRVRFDYGWIVPWVRKTDGGLTMMAGPDSLLLRTPVTTHGHDPRTLARFAVSAGDRTPFVLAWHESNAPAPSPREAVELERLTEDHWREWSDRCAATGPYREEIQDSLTVLKGLIYQPSGGVVAAPTTSLPEQIGGSRNWDYRYCWLRDASMTMSALIEAGYTEEARAWRDWLVRAVAGDPSQLQIMYGIDGSRRLAESELGWLSGFAGSSPVRIGNAAAKQFQLDVPGEVSDAIFAAHSAGILAPEHGWEMITAIAEEVADRWREPDEGIWEVRGGAHHFTHSKVMAWVAADRTARSIRELGLAGDRSTWQSLADQIHADVCAKAFDAGKNSFVQYYGSDSVDASLLLIPLVGFLPANDSRVAGTIEAVERELESDGFVARYRTDAAASDGLIGAEGSFLICSFWLIQAIAAQGRTRRARQLLRRMLDLRNDVGLLSEEYDPAQGRMLGNFPQAFSHIGLVNAAFACSRGGGGAGDAGDAGGESGDPHETDPGS